MSLNLQPVRVNTGFEEEGMLVFDEQQRLLAVLVHLSDGNEAAPGPTRCQVESNPTVQEVVHLVAKNLQPHQRPSA